MSTKTTVLSLAALAAGQLTLSTHAAAQTLGTKVQVHGYLTQGFGASDSLPILGIDRKGSPDYRAAAIQMRVAPTANDAVVVQVANRRMGGSALNALESSVALQWAYYQRRLPGHLTAKLGRSAMARGIYNEVRKVGTVLPFYRAPYSFYTESYETVDGATLSHAASLGHWGLETTVYGGTLDYRQAVPQPVLKPTFGLVNGQPGVVAVTPVRDTTVVLSERGQGTVGGQLWLSTPIEGLRVGVGGNRFTLRSMSILDGRDGRSVASIVQGAVDGNFSRVQARAEWEQFHVGEFLYTSHYAQLGVKLTEKLALNGQREETWTHNAIRPFLLGVPAAATPRTRTRGRYVFDHAVGATYAFRPDVVAKIEGHQNVGSNYDVYVAGRPTGRYFIASLALSY